MEENQSMRSHNMPSLICSYILLLSIALSGCVTINKPNIPFADPIPELNYIENKNPLLAKEIRKLPGVIDGLNNDERIALQRMSQLYREDTADFESAFREMYKIGLPEHRKYCSPLQALFWVARENTLPKIKNLIKPYALVNLLNEAWTFGPQLSSKMLEEIVNTISDPGIRKEFERETAKSNKYLRYRLMSYIKYFPELFPEWVSQKLNEMESNSPWSRYNEVLDRLNSPELVDYYVKNQIGYSNYWEIPGYSGDRGNPYYVFKYKKGDCLYISSFIVEALKRNGYSAWVEKMPPERITDSFHAVCVFEIRGEKYIIDDGRPWKRGVIKYNEY